MTGNWQSDSTVGDSGGAVNALGTDWANPCYYARVELLLDVKPPEMVREMAAPFVVGTEN